jgi:hypothetical protein
MSALGAIIGLVFIVFGIGLTRQIWAQPNAPVFVKAFPILWTAIAVSICIYHVINLFRQRGVADRVVDTDGSGATLHRTEQRLRELSGLRTKNLITEEEYQRRRTEILNQV